MKKHLKIVLYAATILAVVFIALRFAGGAFLSSISAPTITAAPIDGGIIGSRVLAFDLPKYGGGRMGLSDIADHPTIIVFWATWNKESEDQIKILDDYVANEKDQASLVRVVAIDSQEDPSIVSSFIKRGGYNVPVLMDSFGSVSTLFGVKGLPEAYFIGKNGVISEAYSGILSEQSLAQKAESLIKQGGI